MSGFFSFNHYAMATQSLNTRRHWVKGVPGPCAIFSVNRILKSPFLVNRGKVGKTAKPDVDMSQLPGTRYPLHYSRAMHIQIMGNSCFPGPTVTLMGCAYDHREAARNRKVVPKICVGLTASSQLIQPPSTPTGRGPAGLSPLYRRGHCGLKRQLLSVSCHSLPLSLPLCLFLSISASPRISVPVPLCLSRCLSPSPTPSTHI